MSNNAMGLEAVEVATSTHSFGENDNGSIDGPRVAGRFDYRFWTGWHSSHHNSDDGAGSLSDEDGSGYRSSGDGGDGDDDSDSGSSYEEFDYEDPADDVASHGSPGEGLGADWYFEGGPSPNHNDELMEGDTLLPLLYCEYMY